MQCPKCYGEMDNVSTASATSLHLDRCQQCGGLYLDQLTREDVGSLAALVEFDTGDETIGAEYDDTVYVECPKCDKIMDQRLTEEPVRIRFELCPACHATFLDAGELRQYLTEEFKSEFFALLPVR